MGTPDRADADPVAAVVAVVAVDGPAGSGKSSVSMGVARTLGMAYLDTGAMYRALTWAVLRDGVDPNDPAAVAASCTGPDLRIGTDPGSRTVTVDGVDVTTAIREPDVTAAVSAVSAVPAVRARLVGLQRAAVAAATAAGQGIVVEGRDVGTVVLPHADVKVFLVADPTVRAARRAAEDAGRVAAAGQAGTPSAGTATTGGPPADPATPAVAATEADLRRRDALDSGRTASPLARAEDAVEVDATDLTLAEVIDRVVGLVRAAAGTR